MFFKTEILKVIILENFRCILTVNGMLTKVL